MLGFDNRGKKTLLWQVGALIYASASMPQSYKVLDVGSGQDPHPDFGEISLSYSPPYHTQRIAASYTVEFKPKGSTGVPIRKRWSGMDSKEKGKAWLEKITGIKIG